MTPPCFCVDPTTCAACRAEAKTVACSQANPCDNPNHNHTGYRAMDTAPKTCPTCEAHDKRVAMIQVTPKVWICPVQRAGDWPVSRERRAAIKADAYAIDPSCGF